VVIKIHGTDLGASQRAADEMKAILVKIPGVKDLATYQAGSVPQLQIDIERARLSRRGLTVDQVQDAIEIALGGKVATDVWEGERRFSVALKVPEAIRNDIASLGRIVIGAPIEGQTTNTTTLADVSNVLQVEGRGAIWREDFSRFLALKFNVRGRDLGSVIAEAQSKTHEVKLPAGSYVTWGGEFENQQRAMKRLSVAVPISLAVIVLLLYLNFRSWRRPLLVMGTLPLGIVGVIVGLRVTHLHFSVSAAIGCVALVGQMVLGSVLSMERVIEERSNGREGEDAIQRGFARAFRPVSLASALALLGLVPLAMSHGMGAETQRPFAVAILFGGVVGVPSLLLLLPIFESLADRAKGMADSMRRPRTALASLCFMVLAVVLGVRAAHAEEAVTAPAAKPAGIALTEDKAVELTLKSNGSIVAAEKMIAVAEGDRIGAGLYANPRLSLSFGRALVGFDVNGTHMATAEYGQPLYLFGQVKARTSEAEAGVGAAKVEHQAEIWKRSVETRRAFARVWAAQSANEAYADAVRDVSAIAAILETRAKAGFSTDYDALRLGLERDLVKSGGADARANLTKALSELVIAIGDKSLSISRVDGGEPKATTTPPLDALLERALAARQDLRGLKAAESVSLAAIERSKVNAKPVPELFVGAQYSQGPVSVAIYGGINLPLPFFDRGQGAIAHYTADADAKRTLSDAVSKRIEVEVKTARALVEHRLTTLETFETTLATKGVQLRKAAESAYSKGGLSLLELLDAYRSDRELRLRGIELRANLRDAQLDLMEAMGTTPS
jgi:outer membrane protein TolC